MQIISKQMNFKMFSRMKEWMTRRNADEMDEKSNQMESTNWKRKKMMTNV